MCLYLILLFLQIPTAEDVSTLATLRDMTPGGILLLVCGYFIWENFNLKKEVRALNQQLIQDAKEYADILEASTQESQNTVNHLKDIISNVTHTR